MRFCAQPLFFSLRSRSLTHTEQTRTRESCRSDRKREIARDTDVVSETSSAQLDALTAVKLGEIVVCVCFIIIVIIIITIYFS